VRAAAIPPYDPETLPTLIGAWVAYPRRSRPSKRWWGEITHVRFVNENSAAVFVTPNSKKAGKPKWLNILDIRFRKQIDDPLILAMRKAEFNEKMRVEKKERQWDDRQWVQQVLA
jgi:hypothetical protein